MQLKQLAKFEKTDLDNCRAFSTVVSQANYEVKGNALIRVAQLKVWFDGLDKKIDGALKQQALNDVPKVKKIGK